MMTEAGKLNRRISLSTISSFTQSASGEKQQVRTTYASVWALIQPLQPKEIPLAYSYANTVTNKITIRYRNDMKVKDHITYGTRTFIINGILSPDEAHMDTVIFCTEPAVS